MLDKNRRITEYKFNIGGRQEYELGDKLAELTHIKALEYVCLGSAFRDGDFVRFVRNNPGIEKLMICISRSSEVVAAAQYFTNLSELHINCDVHDDDGLRSAIAAILARCHPQYLTVRIGPICFLERNDISYGRYSINRMELPGWNYERSAPIYDVNVHTSDG